MVRLTLTRSVLLSVIILETLYLMMSLQRLAELEEHCAADDGVHVEGHEVKKKAWPPLYVITPTYRRNTQMADMTRMSQTLMLVPNLHWIVVEDAEKTSQVVRDLLDRTGIPYTHLCATMPDEYKDQKSMGKGVFNRREGLRWLRENAHEGVLYFADDDNAYDIRLFEQMRTTKKASVFPVGMILSYGISAPIVRNGKVIGFHDAFQAGRKFAVDMAGFAVNLRVLHASPQATIPLRLSYLEDGFLKSLRLELEDLEPLGSECTEVMVWHTKTHKPATPNPEHISHADFDTNLPDLYRKILR
ncbi:galactosylgalactosylxylosylprotein 3-beta-glucuronosyltransferase P-like [Penaeus japonicus]|uniref:galactosylgalactosylxylosylprotein 3-beta-glucuronosyltransferase P-like n=1 Tax=Penaeus japonicus TaxID=27405 RepID=UPI001C711C04|nr:galactosylgalactosylxylosylprotein 3-beta-glucuronosyltransferase P-like [Penaeus japonicus]XP_042878393.1 galactosylgalactosylxylosylprotein 3-beta-glucuronosyltransferase P-like [Penaeus japonicus]XP_042878394.1 galactosylgalactosylxylosylprotein 3-beta-glucuronosyltransferase P-like [Penaeus japonicus]